MLILGIIYSLLTDGGGDYCDVNKSNFLWTSICWF